MYVYASCIAVMMIFSVLYHLYDEQAYGRFDRTAAIALMLFNFSVSYLAHFPEPYTALAILFVIIAFTFYFTNNEHRYELHHSAWHVSSAIITCLCIAAYATVL